MADKNSKKVALKTPNKPNNQKIKIGEKSFLLRVTNVLIPIIVLIVVVVWGFNFLRQNKNRILVSLLRTAYSTVEQGFKNALIDQGVDNITGTTLWANCNIKNLDKNIEKCENDLKKYFIVKEIIKDTDDKDGILLGKEICENAVGRYNKWWHLNSNSQCSGWNNLTFILNNGMKIDLLAIGANDSYIVGQVTLDINGSSEPNRWGRDAFMFNVTKDGSLIPYGGRRDCKRLAEYLDMDLDSVLSQRHWQYTDICSSSTTSDGTACAARIIENNWKMDY